MWKWIGIAVVALMLGSGVSGAEGTTLTGSVTDPTGKPIDHATVMVYHAGVKTGYSLFCPSCYADCGKRVFTDAAGTYSFANLAPDLWFELLIVRNGYVPVIIRKVDPSSGVPTTAVLTIRLTGDPLLMIRGRVVDANGNPLRDVVVQPHGVESKKGMMIGHVPDLDPVLVTNEMGEFEASYIEPNSRILLFVEARTMAPKYVVVSTGTERQTVRLAEGAVIRGHLVADGKGVGGAEIGIYPKSHGGWGPNFKLHGSPFQEITIGTQEDGSFAITNIATPEEWYVYGKMESLRTRGATQPVLCATSKDKEQIDVGDIQLKPGHRLHGKVVLSDGNPLPVGMRVNIASDSAWDFQTTTIAADGRFEFTDLPSGGYSITPYVKGFSLPDGTSSIPVLIDRDLDNWSVVLTRQTNTPTHR
jgi:Carboxypeptidase regulatory-like domain